MKNRFIGDTQIPSFDGKSTINLTDYTSMEMPYYEGFQFQYITVWDISQYTIKSDVYKNLEQYEIRYNEACEEAKQEMQDSYARKDWDTNEGQPPQWTVDENGDIDENGAIDGRRRVGGAIECGAKFIPIAVYKVVDGLDDDEEYQYRQEAAQKANDMSGSKRYNGKMDYIMTGVEFIRREIIGKDSDSILTWLEDRMEYKTRFPNPSTQKEVYNKIYEWGNASYTLTKDMSTPMADAWVKENGYNVKDSNGHFDKNLITVCVDNVRYADRLMADAIIPAVLAIKRTDPVNIIFYSKKRKPSDIKKNTKIFAEAIETAYRNCFKLVEVIIPVLAASINENVPEGKPWEILGCIPQIQDEQDVDAGKLIPYEEVIASLSKKKKKRKVKVSNYPEIDESLGVAA